MHDRQDDVDLIHRAVVPVVALHSALGMVTQLFVPWRTVPYVVFGLALCGGLAVAAARRRSPGLWSTSGLIAVAAGALPFLMPAAGAPPSRAAEVAVVVLVYCVLIMLACSRIGAFSLTRLRDPELHPRPTVAGRLMQVRARLTAHRLRRDAAGTAPLLGPGTGPGTLPGP